MPGRGLHVFSGGAAGRTDPPLGVTPPVHRPSASCPEAGGAPRPATSARPRRRRGRRCFSRWSCRCRTPADGRRRWRTVVAGAVGEVAARKVRGTGRRALGAVGPRREPELPLEGVGEDVRGAVADPAGDRARPAADAHGSGPAGTPSTRSSSTPATPTGAARRATSTSGAGRRAAGSSTPTASSPSWARAVPWSERHRLDGDLGLEPGVRGGGWP